jgi:hypothetical protein
MIKSTKELYEAVDKRDLFNSINDCMEDDMHSEDSSINLLLDSKLKEGNDGIEISSKINKAELVDFEYANMLSYIRRVFRKYNLDTDFGNIFDKLVADYTDSDEANEAVKVANNLLEERYNRLKNNSYVYDAYEVNQLDDNIGDKTLLNEKIDLGMRDGNFIIIDGKVITGDDNATHSQLINEYIDEYLHEEVDEDLNDLKVRDTDMFNQISDNTPIVFGHIVDGIAFIEECVECAINDAVTALKNQCNFKKIYEYDAAADAIIRLAKRR